MFVPGSLNATINVARVRERSVQFDLKILPAVGVSSVTNVVRSVRAELPASCIITRLIQMMAEPV